MRILCIVGLVLSYVAVASLLAAERESQVQIL